MASGLFRLVASLTLAFLHVVGLYNYGVRSVPAGGLPHPRFFEFSSSIELWRQVCWLVASLTLAFLHVI